MYKGKLVKLIRGLPVFWLILLFVLSVGVFGLPQIKQLIWTAEAYLTSGSNAVNGAGQLSGGVPYYTKSGENNGLNGVGFKGPYATAIDPTDNRLFVADTGNHRVLVFNLNASNVLVDYTADNVLGQASLIDNISNTSATGMSSPNGLTYDDANNRLFVSDNSANRVTVYDVTAITDGETAISVLGQSNFTNSNSATTIDGLSSPTGLAYDSVNSYLFVSDRSNSRVIVYDVAAITDGENAINVLGQADFTSSGSATTVAGMSSPRGIAYDSGGTRLFVGDESNNRVLVYNMAVIGDGEDAVNVLGQEDFTSSGSASTAEGMGYVSGIAYDSGNDVLYVADGSNNSGNDRVLQYNVSAISDGDSATKVLGQLNFTDTGGATTQAKLSGPMGISFASNLLYVPELSNNRIMVFDVTAITNGEDAVNGAGQLSGGSPIYTEASPNNGPTALGFDSPLDIAVDTVNHRLFASDRDNNRILVFNLNSSDQLIDYTADNVLGQSDFVSNSSARTSTTLSSPNGIYYDDSISGTDRLFVADSGNARVLIYDVTSISDGEAAVNVLGPSDFTSSSSGTTQSRFNTALKDLIIDTNNSLLFVADSSNNRVMVFDISINDAGCSTPNDGICDGENALYVLGQADFTSNSVATTQAGLKTPYSIAYDTINDRVFVAEYGNNRVVVYDIGGGAALSTGRSADNVLGQVDFDSGSSATTQAGLNTPTYIDYDEDNDRLYISEYYGSRIVIQNFAGEAIVDGENAESVLGPDQWWGWAWSGTDQAKIQYPYGVHYVETSDRLFVADAGNNRLMVYDAESNAPTATTPTFSSQATDGTGYVTFRTTIDDPADDDTKLKIEYSDDGGSTFYDPDLISVVAATGTPDLDDAEVYQIGTNTGIDTGSGSNALTIVWATLSASNGNGSLAGTEQNDIQIRVTPHDGTNIGEIIASASFTVDDLAPSGLTALSVSDKTTTTVDLSWSAVTETNFDHYEIWYGTVEGDVATFGGTAIEWDDTDDIDLATRTTIATTITGLSEGTQYYFKIIAADLYSNTLTVAHIGETTDVAQVTSVSGANATTLSAYAVNVTFTTGSETGIKIEQDTDCDGYETTVYDNAGTVPQSPYNVSSLAAATCYKFRISAYNSASDLNTASIPETSNITTPPAQPTSLTALAADTSSITWDWDDVTGATDYYIYRADSALVGTVGGSTSGYTQTTVIDGGAALSTNTQYTVSVRAVNANGTGIASSPASAYTDADAPTSLTHSANTTSSITWSWSSGGAQNSYYASTSTPVDNSGWVSANGWIQSGLSANTAVEVSVKAKNEEGTETSTVTNTVYTAQNTPTDISKSDLSTTSLTVIADGTFNNLASGSSGLYFANSTAATNSGWTQTNSWASSSLSANTEYAFAVTARNGDGDEIPEVTGASTFYTAQNTPTSVSESSSDFTSITVDANGTLPNLASGTAGLYYENVTAGTNSGWVQSTSWTSTSLSPNTAYEFRVKARNGDSVETAFTGTTSITTAVPSSSGGPPSGNDDSGDDPTSEPSTQCADGIDNDSDGDIDLNDDGCADGLDNDESDELEIPPVLDEPADGILTNNNQPYIIGTTPEGAMSLDVYIDNEKIHTLLSQVDKSFVWKIAPALLDGLYEIYVKVQNLVSSVHTILVDTAPPNSPLIDLVTVESQAPIGDDINAGLKIQGQVYSDTKYVLLYLDDNILIDTIEVTSSTWSYDYNEVLSPGEHKISAKAIDDADNISVVPTEENFDLFISGDNTDEPIVDEPIIDDPIVDEPIVDEPIVIDPIVGGPIVVDPIVAGSIVKDPIDVDPIVVTIYNDIVGKNEWDKTKDDIKFEIVYETERIMDKPVTKKTVDLVSKVIVSFTKGDIADVAKDVEQAVRVVVKTTNQVQKATIDNPVAEKVNDIAKEETMGAVAATSVASLATVGVTGTAGASALTYFQFLFTQPLMLLTRRKKRGWGVIYNSVTKQPVDLAVVRVYNSETEKLVTTRVTDKQGRYQFILKPGKYKIVADKKEFKFPSTLLNKETVDGQFNDVYYGDEFEVTEKDAVAIPIPLDPQKAIKKGKSEIKMYMIRKGQLALTFAGPTLAIISFIVNPQLWVGGVVIGQIAMYGVFKKLAVGDKPKNWGVVKNVDNKKKLARSIVRVFDTKFNKLLETQVTDGKGRYAFLVGNQEYFMTAEKPGFHKKQSERFNLSGEESGYLAEDFKLKPHYLGKEVKKAQEVGGPVTIRTGLGEQKEKEINGQKKVVRPDDEKFKGELKEVDLDNVHEDYYDLDVLKK